MKSRRSGLLAIAGFALAGLLGSAQSVAQNAYITNFESNFVSVIDTTTNAVIAGIPVGTDPNSLAGTPDGSTVYVANKLTNNVSRIATATNTVTATIHVGFAPVGVATTVRVQFDNPLFAPITFTPVIYSGSI